MLRRKISQDEDVAKLSLKAAFLYTWLIPHADVKGRLYGDTLFIKANIIPHVDEIKVAGIKKLLIEIAKNNLICYYGDKVKYIQLRGWKSNQDINEGREAKSEIPEPTPEQIRSKSGVTLQEVEVEVQDKVEVEVQKDVSPEPQAASVPEVPFLVFPTVGKVLTWDLTPGQVEQFRTLFPGVVVEQACRNALAWCIGNPTKRKTAGGMLRFLTRWLTGDQEKGGKNGTGKNKPEGLKVEPGKYDSFK